MSYLLAGPLKITIEHEQGAPLHGTEYPYKRPGPPAVWGDGLEHVTIEGLSGDPTPDPNAPVDSLRAPSALSAGLSVLATGLMLHGFYRVAKGDKNIGKEELASLAVGLLAVLTR